jgi:enoyl-CoA hydratase/carnithine racemase
MSANSNLVIVDEPAPAICRLTLNRPERRNALSEDMLGTLDSALVDADRSESVRVVIIRGAGPSFCAGADLKEQFRSDGEDPDARDIGSSPVWHRIESLRIPVVAAVHGWAVTGGFLLAYCCDLIIASKDAKFRDTHAALGLIPTGGETQRMPRRLGLFLARELMMTSRTMTAIEAHDRGLLSRVVDRERLDDESIDLALLIASNSARSVTAIKRAVNVGAQMDFQSGIKLEYSVNNSGRANQDHDADRQLRIARLMS